MKKTKVSVVALVLAFAMALMPLAVVASAIDEPIIRSKDEVAYVPLRPAAYALGAEVEWDRENRAAVITMGGETNVIVIADVGGFVEDGVAWVPIDFALNELIFMSDLRFSVALEILIELFGMESVTEEIIYWDELWDEFWDEFGDLWDDFWDDLITELNVLDQRVDRIDLTLWDQENFADVREPSFSTDLPHGVIAVNYIEYMRDNLGARSAFTYRELEAAVWIVEELLAMGHDWDNISVQEFTYWCAAEIDLALRWSLVTSRFVLGVGREYQLRPDRVSQNVILTIPGQSERKIIVGAHYDSPPYASASDNASGTALLLESAKRMLELEHYYTIVYVFFGAEEVGLIGAYYYYESLTQAQRDNILMMVNADVLIEGPYVIYGAGGAPDLDEIDMDEIIEMIFDFVMEITAEIFDEMMADVIAGLEALGEGMSEFVEFLPFYSLESYVEFLMIPILATLHPHELLMEAAAMGLIEPIINPVAAQVSAIAAELTAQHDFEIMSLPEFVAIPSDHLVFLLAGHTVVNLTGLERYGVLGPELTNRLTRYGEFGHEFTPTILHTPLDEFNFIEYTWPGMMNANMKAFTLFLEAILTSRFS